MCYWVFVLCILLSPWAGFCLGIGFSFFNPALVFFVGWLTLLPRRLIAFAMLHFGLCSLGLLWAYCTLSLLLSSCSLILLLGLFSYYFGLPWPILFLWASSAHFIPSFLWVFAKSFGLPWPNYHILYFQGLLAFLPTLFTSSFLWAPLAYFCLLSIFHNFHEFTSSFFELP